MRLNPCFGKKAHVSGKFLGSMVKEELDILGVSRDLITTTYPKRSTEFK